MKNTLQIDPLPVRDKKAKKAVFFVVFAFVILVVALNIFQYFVSYT